MSIEGEGTLGKYRPVVVTTSPIVVVVGLCSGIVFSEGGKEQAVNNKANNIKNNFIEEQYPRLFYRRSSIAFKFSVEVN
jgi:hypothetical protein